MIDNVRDNNARNRYARLFPLLMKKNTTEKQKHMTVLIRIMIDRFPMAETPLVSLYTRGDEDVFCGDFSKENRKRQNKRPYANRYLISELCPPAPRTLPYDVAFVTKLQVSLWMLSTPSLAITFQ